MEEVPELRGRIKKYPELEHTSYLMLVLLNLKALKRESKKSSTRKTLKSTKINRKILKLLSPMAKLTQSDQDNIRTLTLTEVESLSTPSERGLKLHFPLSLRVEALKLY